MRATLWQVLNVPTTVHTLCTALLELKCVDRQQWQQTRALDRVRQYGAVQRSEECEEHLPLSPRAQPTRNRPQIAPRPRPAPERGKDRGILEESAWVRLSWINENLVRNCYSLNCASSQPN